MKKKLKHPTMHFPSPKRIQLLPEAAANLHKSEIESNMRKFHLRNCTQRTRKIESMQKKAKRKPEKPDKRLHIGYFLKKSWLFLEIRLVTLYPGPAGWDLR